MAEPRADSLIYAAWRRLALTDTPQGCSPKRRGRWSARSWTSGLAGVCGGPPLFAAALSSGRLHPCFARPASLARSGVIGHMDDSPRPWVSIDQTVVGKSATVVGECMRGWGRGWVGGKGGLQRICWPGDHGHWLSAAAGALREEVAVMNSLTVNLHLLMVRAPCLPGRAWRCTFTGPHAHTHTQSHMRLLSFPMTDRGVTCRRAGLAGTC
jgi:hypothetical protein